jgi:hypothetical protein
VADEVSLDEILDDLGTSVDPGQAGAAIATVADLLLAGGSHDDFAAAAALAAEALWSPDLEQDIRNGLQRLRQDYQARFAAVDAAENELGKPPRDNAVAVALAARAAIDLWARARQVYGHMAALEDDLKEAPREMRGRALVAATAVIPVLELDPNEVERAVTAYLSRESEAWLARELATPDRRRALRRALGRLADAGENEFPLATTAITTLLAEPMAADPADDELWVGLVVGLAQRQMNFEPG